MTFSNDVRNGFFFSERSNECLDRAEENFSYSLSQIASPYYDLTSNAKAFGHPFFHTTQLLRDAGHFVYGAFVLVGALSTGHFSAAGKAAFGMMQLVGAAALEVLNIALSIVSLATRFLASLFNFGYVSTSIQLRGAHLNGAEIGGRNEETTMNMFQVYNFSAINIAAKTNDEFEHQTAFTLI